MLRAYQERVTGEREAEIKECGLELRVAGTGGAEI